MKKLYLKIIIGMLAATVLSAATPAIFFLLFSDKDFIARNELFSDCGVRFIKNRLGAVPPEQVETRLKSLRKQIYSEIRITHWDDATIPQTVRDALSQDNESTIHPANDPSVYFCMNDCAQVAIITSSTFPPHPFQSWQVYFMIFINIITIAVIGFLLTFPLIRQIRVLENAMVLLSNGNLSTRAALTSKDAVGHLAEFFNQMAEKIQALLESRQHLLQAVSHELRTPISRIGFNLALLTSAKNEQGKEEQAQEIERELEELKQLVSELLLYTRYDSGSKLMKKKLFLLSELLPIIAEKGKNTRPDVEIIIHYAKPDIRVTVDETSFKRAIQNLLSNAVRYANKKISINADRTAEHIIVEVLDDGPGIPEVERKNIFQPFYRADSSRSRESGGVGLGLAIVARIVESHGGHVSFSQINGSGARFTTAWPAEQ